MSYYFKSQSVDCQERVRSSEGLEHKGEGQRKRAEVLLGQEEGKIMLICNSLD